MNTDGHGFSKRAVGCIRDRIVRFVPSVFICGAFLVFRAGPLTGHCFAFATVFAKLRESQI
jgi:hypothetical protein